MPASEERYLLTALGQPDADAPTEATRGTNDNDSH
jgi:hypothetical protein